MRRGFTLIEVVIVVGISVILTAIVLGYSATGRDQIYLSIQKAQIGQVMAKAKSLAVSTYNQPNVPCGFGVYFNYAADPPEYEIFRYKTFPCPVSQENLPLGIARQNFSCNSPNVPDYCYLNQYTLPTNLEFGSGNYKINTVFFIPPNPQTMYWPNTQGKPGIIYLQTKNGNASAEVSVNSGGQITF